MKEKVNLLSQEDILLFRTMAEHYQSENERIFFETMKYKEEHHEIKKYENKQETPHYKEPKTESFMFADDYMDEHFKRLREDKMKGKN